MVAAFRHSLSSQLRGDSGGGSFGWGSVGGVTKSLPCGVVWGMSNDKPTEEWLSLRGNPKSLEELGFVGNRGNGLLGGLLSSVVRQPFEGTKLIPRRLAEER